MAKSRVAFFEQESHSFVIRLWREESAAPKIKSEWRGWIEHVQSRQRHHFQGQNELYEIMSIYLGDTTDLNQVWAAVSDQQHDAS